MIYPINDISKNSCATAKAFFVHSRRSRLIAARSLARSTNSSFLLDIRMYYPMTLQMQLTMIRCKTRISQHLPPHRCRDRRTRRGKAPRPRRHVASSEFSSE